MAALVSLAADGVAERAGRGFEEGLGAVVVVPAVEHGEVEVHPGVLGEAIKEVPHHLRREVADGGAVEGGVEHEVEPAGEVDGAAGQRLVHRHERVAVAVDVGLVAERFGERLPERDAHVLDGVVVVHVQVALAADGEAEAAVAREEVEHVVEEADARGVVVVAAVEREVDRDAGFGGGALDAGGAGREAWAYGIGRVRGQNTRSRDDAV